EAVKPPDEVHGPERATRSGLSPLPRAVGINVGEVSYVLKRLRGAEASEDVVAALRASRRLEEPTATRVLQAADVRARHRVSCADAFATATARTHRLPVLTGDPEILAGVRPDEVDDLRRS